MIIVPQWISNIIAIALIIGMGFFIYCCMVISRITNEMEEERKKQYYESEREKEHEKEIF